MNCPKCLYKMTMLFTSYACDRCDGLLSKPDTHPLQKELSALGQHLTLPAFQYIVRCKVWTQSGTPNLVMIEPRYGLTLQVKSGDRVNIAGIAGTVDRPTAPWRVGSWFVVTDQPPNPNWGGDEMNVTYPPRSTHNP